MFRIPSKEERRKEVERRRNDEEKAKIRERRRRAENAVGPLTNAQLAEIFPGDPILNILDE